MLFSQFVSAVKNGIALPMGFENANAPKPEFVNQLTAAGETGLECTIDLTASSFDVRENIVKNPNSPAFGKIVGNVSVNLRIGNVSSNVSIDLGTLGAFATGKGKATIHAVQPKDATTGLPLQTRGGNPIYNFRAVNPPAFGPELLAQIESFVASKPASTASNPTAKVVGEPLAGG